MTSRWMLILTALFVLGVFAGRQWAPHSELQPPVAPVPAPPAPPVPASSQESELKDARLQVEFLRQEIADQDRRRQGLEAELLAARQAAARLPAPATQLTSIEKRFEELSTGSPNEEVADLTRELLRNPEAVRGFLNVFEKATEQHAVCLWDVANGTCLAREGGNGTMISKLPELRQGIEALLQKEADPRKRKLLENLLTIANRTARAASGKVP